MTNLKIKCVSVNQSSMFPMARTVTVTVYTKIPNLLEELKLVLPHIHFKEITSDKDERLAQSEVILADFDLLAPHLYNLPKTKWVQGTWAGVDKLLPYINKAEALPYVITRFSGEHFGRIMAEYVIAQIVSNERDFASAEANQRVKMWSKVEKVGAYRTISDLNIGLLGIGQIGSWIGRTLRRFGANIFGYGRRSSLDLNLNECFTGYYSKPGLQKFLNECDYLVNVLPETPETIGLLNGDVLESCKGRQAVFVNIGRGSIISDLHLIAALDKGWLSAAVLDVFNEEPLPKHSPLWSMPQVKITPHVAGSSRAKDIAQQFQDNLRLYLRSEVIPATLDLEKWY